VGTFNLTRAVETLFKKPKFFRFFKRPEKLDFLGFLVFLIFKSEFLLFHVKLCKFL